MVPKGWLELRIENCLKDQYSMAYGILQPGDDIAGGIPMLRTVDIGISGLIGSKVICVTKELHDEYSRTALNGGEVLLSVMGTIGRTIVVPESCCGWNVNRALAVIRLKSDIDPFYFCEYLKSPFINDRLVEQAIGSAQKRINLGDLRKYIVRIPPYHEQRKIAQILSTWDKAITTTERLLTNRQQHKKALMQRLLTGKQRFAGFEGEWNKATLVDVAKITMGSSPNSVAYNEEGVGLPLLQGNADIKNRRSCPRIFTSQITKECLINDILLSVRAPVGSVATALHNACIGRGIASIRAVKGVSQNFLYQWLLDFEPKWERYSQGSTFESVNSDDIKLLHILIPSIQEQQKIASVLSTADAEITTIQNQLDNLKQQKKALMQQLLTGKRRVKVDSLALAAQ